MKKGFTLIELLVVISIIGILIAVSIFGLSGAREAARDARRKSDLQLIQSGLEIYKADCNAYPVTAKIVAGATLVGLGTPSTCAVANTYISLIPSDPIVTNLYRYAITASGYEICTSLEQGTGNVTCGGSSNCGKTCNYKVTNP
ncbi:MAG: prepilin-type N-terminal cleavage/methylation domain-containing protein [Candidatus Woesebacteria bacterium]|nr:prepilin-type N-terminal cleavage/methylation domain-containing protein [Candidatus Woesebacteria bacterium]